MNKKYLYLLIALVLASLISGQEDLSSVEDNSIKISAPDTTYCTGTECVIKYTIENLGTKTTNVTVDHDYKSSAVKEIKTEHYTTFNVEKELNIPYKCDTIQLNNSNSSNNSIVKDIYCDNITQVIEQKTDFKSVASADVFALEKGTNTFKKTVFQPLGQKTKYDIITYNDDGSKTILDPWIDTEHYYINLSDYRYLAYDSVFYMSVDNVTLESSYTVNGSTYTSSGKIYGAYGFDGNNDYIDTNFAPSDYTNQMSFSLWVKSNDTDIYDKLFSQTISNTDGLRVYFHYDNIGNVTILFKDDNINQKTVWLWDADSVVNYYDGNWHHWVIKVDSSSSANNELWIDNNNITTKTKYYTASGFTASNMLGGNLYLGADNDDGVAAGFLNTYIDEFTIYNRSLTNTEISNIYNYERNQLINNSVFNNENLSINSSYTGVQIDYDTNIINSMSDSIISETISSGNCYTFSGSELNWTINATLNYALNLDKVVNYTFMNCDVNESIGRQAIIDGIDNSDIAGSYTTYDDKQIYIRLANGSQYDGTFDKFIVSGNKRWAFNYDENSSSSFPVMTNISPVFYVWQNFNMTSYAIKNAVTSLIDNTN